MDRVKGKVALVTGAAMGMGKTHSELLAAEGAMVFVTDRDEVSGAAVVKSIKDAGGQAEFIKHDVTLESDWANVAATIKKQAGKLDILVNNAGILLFKPVHETEPDEWDQVMNVNVKGVYLGIRACTPLMIANGGGSIINISSIYGIVAAPMAGAYIASKGAVRLMTKSCAVDLVQHNIRVNSIHPGVIDTPMTKELLHGDAESYKAIMGATLFDRACQPEEVSQAVLFLASDDSSFMHGSELVVDGGYTAN